MKKSTPKKTRSALTPEDRALVIAFINKSRNCVGTVLECGSDWASTLHEIDDMGRHLGKQLGLKQENLYSDFK